MRHAANRSSSTQKNIRSTSKIGRIVFLDMDGVCCSDRAAFVLGEHCIDPMAIQFLNHLHRSAPFRLVAISSWRRNYYLPVVMEAVGCAAPFADPWRIEDGKPKPQGIADWLSENAGGSDFLIFDDEECEWNDEQRARWICCEAENGITLSAMRRAFEIFDQTVPRGLK